MLHMIINTHNPESCAFRGDEEGRLLSEALDAFDETGDSSVRVIDSWVNRASHEIFILADAPNANVIDDALLSAGLVGRTHSRVVAVMTTKDVQVPGRERQTSAASR